MLPRRWIQAMKNRTPNDCETGGQRRRFALAACLVLLSGCTPPGPRALLEGKRLIENGRYLPAVERLNRATTLLATNAQAWNYLGLACHYAGRFEEAERSYKRALLLNRDLTEAHYNLACLWLAQNKPEKTEAAKTELLAYTLRQGNSADGLLKLGLAQLRSRELVGAEKSFADALRLNPRSPEGLNGLGLVQIQRGHGDEAAKLFRSALKIQQDYRPALLNLAIVSDVYLKDRRLALQKYREYADLKPASPEVQAVRLLALQIEHELNPPQRPALTNLAPQPKTNTTPPKPVVTNGMRTAIVPRVDSSTNPPKAAPAPTPVNFEAVKLAAEPVFKPAQDISVSPPPVGGTAAEPMISNPVQSGNVPQPEAQRRGLLQRINPFNLFRNEEKKSSRPMPLPPATDTPQPQPLSSAAALDGIPGASPALESVSMARYSYKMPPSSEPGNRAEAQRVFDQGIQAQQAHRVEQAVRAYRQAAQVDPSFFEAHYNLGLAAAEAGDLPAALASYENALTVRPDSLDARYNFALVLKQSNYFVDAANELEKLLATYPNEGKANLALGNLYAQQLRQPPKARQHYLRVLETDPHNSQASAIRYWLAANPQ